LPFSGELVRAKPAPRVRCNGGLGAGDLMTGTTFAKRRSTYQQVWLEQSRVRRQGTRFTGAGPGRACESWRPGFATDRPIRPWPSRPRSCFKIQYWIRVSVSRFRNSCWPSQS